MNSIQLQPGDGFFFPYVYRQNQNQKYICKTERQSLQKITFSNHLFLCEKVLNNLFTMSEDLFCVCVSYIEGDIQIGLTESAKRHEKPEETITRCLVEEIGLKPKKSIIPFEYKYFQKHIAFTSLSTEELSPYASIQTNKSKFDIRNSKAFICVIDTLENLSMMLSHERCIVDNADLPNITGVAIIKLSIIIDFIKRDKIYISKN